MRSPEEILSKNPIPRTAMHMMIDATVIKVIHNPRSGVIEHAQLDVSFEGIAALIGIDLRQPVVGDTTEVLAFELGRLGRALVQISQQPSLLSLPGR